MLITTAITITCHYDWKPLENLSFLQPTALPNPVHPRSVCCDQAAGDVLWCNRSNLYVWNLSGGAVEVGELPDQTLVREVIEETGLAIRSAELLGVHGKPGRNDVVFVFRCHDWAGTPQPTAEADQLAFFPPFHPPSTALVVHVERVREALREWTGVCSTGMRRALTLTPGARCAEGGALFAKGCPYSAACHCHKPLHFNPFVLDNMGEILKTEDIHR